MRIGNYSVGINFPFSGHPKPTSRPTAPIRPVCAIGAGHGNKRFSLQTGFRRQIEKKFRFFTVARRFFQHCVDAPVLRHSVCYGSKTQEPFRNQRGIQEAGSSNKARPDW
jgi:hypothetical protein